ncbi:MAG: ABC transporter [Opitutae bacterium]|nr:ABC transporter [Opitutae bacterium]|tara:strand:- start:1671 stop:3398 length:1728 start_codon:yes stop_codon:yes gene_type:complete
MLRPVWLPFLGALLCGIIYGAASGFGLPFVINKIFPKIFSSEGIEVEISNWQLMLYVSWLPIAFLIRGVSGYFNSYLINFCGVRVLEKLRLKVFAKLQRLPLAFFRKNQSGDLLSRVMTDAWQLQQAILNISNDLIKQPVTFFGALAALVYMALEKEGLAFVLLCLLVIPVCVFPMRYIGTKILNRAMRMQERAGGLTSVLNENFSATTEVRSFNLEERETGRFGTASREFFSARMKVIKYIHLLTPVIEVITAIGVSIAIYRAARGGISLEVVVPVIMALYMSYEPVKKLGLIHNQIKQALASLDRLEYILLEPETTNDSENPKKIDQFQGKITFENVSFEYEKGDERPALSNIDLTIEPDEVVALIGPSGAGKTTLADLLPRFHDPTDGRVTLDGIDLRELKLKDLRNAVALVPQHPFLFDATVRENVELGQAERSSATVEEVCALAHANEFIENFEQGYDEPLGEEGSRLSGGQLQRLALARAFLKNAPILVLDEATSALDSENEEKIQEAMTNLVKGKTTLLIAHRFSSLKLATRILVMDKGRIVADGSHDELYRDCELYRNLHKAQEAIN